MLKTKNQIIWISTLLLLLVGIIDFIIPFEITTFIFYVIPIFLFSYQNKISQIYLILFSSIAAIEWGILDYFTHPYTNDKYFFFNWLARATIFILTSIVLKRIVIEKEQKQIISIQKNKLEEINKKLQSANDELNKFIGMAAHDIRNPVGNILSFSRLLLDDETLTEEKKILIQLIKTSATNSLQILNDTLNISQIQSGTISLNKSKNEYINFVKECLILNSQLSIRKKQNIRFISSINSIDVEFDKSRLLQVINNLLTNAVKYSEFNKEIIVKVKQSEKHNGFLITEIIDEGPGIDDKYHSKIFEPFATTSNIPTDNETKSGLGLAIAKKIIELHKGTLDFTSEKGKGSNFFFSIPI